MHLTRAFGSVRRNRLDKSKARLFRLTQELNSIQDLISNSRPAMSVTISSSPAAPPPPGMDVLLEAGGDQGDRKERDEMFQAVLATRTPAKEQSELKEPEKLVDKTEYNSSGFKTPDGSLVRGLPKLSETLTETPINHSIALAWATISPGDQSPESQALKDLQFEFTDVQPYDVEPGPITSSSAPLVSLVDLDQPSFETTSRVSSTGSVTSADSESKDLRQNLKRGGRKSRAPKYSAPRTPSKDSSKSVRSIKRRPSGSARDPAGLSDV